MFYHFNKALYSFILKSFLKPPSKNYLKMKQHKTWKKWKDANMSDIRNTLLWDQTLAVEWLLKVPTLYLDTCKGQCHQYLAYHNLILVWNVLSYNFLIFFKCKQQNDYKKSISLTYLDKMYQIIKM